jgi:hypothetical protein
MMKREDKNGEWVKSGKMRETERERDKRGFCSLLLLEQTKPTPGASTILSPKKANLKSKSLKP